MTRFDVVAETGSTNADLRDAAAADPPAWPHLSALLAHAQTAGRGRTGRSWSTDGHDALTFSVVLRPRVPRERWGWAGLLAGAAVVRALRGTTAEVAAGGGVATAVPTPGGGVPAGQAGTKHPDGTAALGLKWPNDVVHLAVAGDVPGWGRMRKVGGLLTEVLPDGSGLVVGIGVNLAGEHLPVAWAGTVADLGVTVTDVDLARRILIEVEAVLSGWEAGARPVDVVAPLCLTLGTPVAVDLPGGERLEGVATSLDEDGGLVVRSRGGARTVRAGDVSHLRGAARARHGR